MFSGKNSLKRPLLSGRKLDINQKYDRPLPDLFNFTALLLGIHVQLIQNAQQSSGVETGLGINQSVQLLSPYNAGYFTEAESLSGRVFSLKQIGF